MPDQVSTSSPGAAGAGDPAAELQRALERAAAQWRTTFDAIGSPIVILGLDGTIRRLNRAARDLAGKTFQELLDRPAGEVATSPLFRKAAETIAEVRASRSTVSYQVEDAEQGRTWDVAAHFRAAGPEVDEDQVILVARDITRLVELQESLRRSEMMSALGSLIAGVAHQVRNPIFGMTAALDAFEARFGDREELQRYLEVLREPLGRLSELMRDLLEYGKPPVESRSPGSMATVLAEAVRNCGPLAEQAGVTIRLGPAEELPPVVMDHRLVQAFQNLLENAVQHSPPGGVVEIASAIEDSGAKRWVVCRILDQGPGFAAEDLPRLFEPFFTRRRGGTGLGLAIVRRFVEDNGGRVSAANRPGGGAIVEARLPATAES